MLETFRKHHYILMCFIAVAVIIAFTFIGNPWNDRGGPPGSSQRVGTLYGRDFTLGEVQGIAQLQSITGQLAQMAQDRTGDDPVSQYGQVMSSIVNTVAPTKRDEMDLDYPINVLVLRKECESLGIDVEREDVEKFIKEIGAFRTNAAFDASKLEKFLADGMHGDRSATETKLLTALRDVMLFRKLAKLVGGSFAPSKAEADSAYAETNQLITAATVLIEKKAHENQTITDEEIQKYYDGEKAKKEGTKSAEKDSKAEDSKEPKEATASADPLVLSEEKRTVKYVFTEAPVAPVAPTPPPKVPPLEDVSKLPEDQKKAKEEEHKKKEEEFTKATEEHTKKMAEHETKTKEHTDAKNAWLKTVAQLSDALASDERGGKSFDDLAKELKFEVKPATFTKAMPPEELKKMKVRGPEGQVDAAEAIFKTEKGEGETMLEDQNGPSYCFFSITAVEEASLLPLEEVKQKITDKLKAEKVAAAVKAAAESARSNILDGVKEGKSFKDAATEKAMLTAAELPAFSKKKPLPPATPNSAIIRSAITGDEDMGMGAKKSPGLNAGELSQPLDVPEGLLLVYVDKRELPNHPQIEQLKRALTQERTFRNAAATVNFSNFSESTMATYQYFHGTFGGLTNPVFKAWFSARRANAQAVSQ